MNTTELFLIAMADGGYHPQEDAFLAEVARIFGLDDRCFRVMRARFVEGVPRDPYEVLGIPPDASLAEARKAWRAAVKESHPDAMIARGVPAEAVKLAERRLIAINADTGKVCEGFGNQGVVDLTTGIGPFTAGAHFADEDVVAHAVDNGFIGETDRDKAAPRQRQEIGGIRGPIQHHTGRHRHREAAREGAAIGARERPRATVEIIEHCIGIADGGLSRSGSNASEHCRGGQSKADLHFHFPMAS